MLPYGAVRSTEQLRGDAVRIWEAGVEAVRSDRLVRDYLRAAGGWLYVGDEAIDLSSVDRIVVVGAGKAGAGMAAAVEEALGPRLLEQKQVEGWVNVPADCVRPLPRIHLHAARPAGVNEPTSDGVRGSIEISKIVESLSPRDLCLCLISGGGSALLPLPADGVSLEDKAAVTRFLSAAGANIQELNTVRKQLSRIKGGGLARSCRAGRLITLVISDVLGDPLDVIASGPTVADASTPADALAILERFGARAAGVPQAVFLSLGQRETQITAPTCRVTNLVIGNNATAVDAAGAEAERLGYRHAMYAASQLEGPAEGVGKHLATMAREMLAGEMLAGRGPNCLITGGEPVVRLVDAAQRGKGGRNQQLVLAALIELSTKNDAIDALRGLVLLSGGTDGEDGPTDAAGALVDEDVARRVVEQKLDPRDFLSRNDAYTFFERTGGLIKTGPTHTNVCDVRVVLVDR
jgi:hydroxypyruvate reductase